MIGGIKMLDKKEIKKRYKETLPPMGIYQIKNSANGKILIGNSKNLTGKSNSYKFQLNLGSHINKELQKDYNKYGDENFSFEVLDYLEALEELWIDKLQPFNEKGYNKQKNNSAL